MTNFNLPSVSRYNAPPLDPELVLSTVSNS
nr:MAG TPA: hypothetical protein [Caudoviricetes sp.]